MKNKIIFTVELLSLLVLTIPKNVFAEKTTIAIVVDSRGDVKLNTPGQPVQDMTVGMEVAEGDSITTGAKAYVKLIRTDSSIIKLNEETQFDVVPAITGEEKGSVFSIKSGKLFMNVFKEKEVSKKVLIKTPAAVCMIRGTQIYVSVSESGESTFILLSGSADVFNDSGTVQMNEGSRVTAQPNYPPSPPSEFYPGTIERWDEQIEGIAPRQPQILGSTEQPVREAQPRQQIVRKPGIIKVYPYLNFSVISDDNMYLQKNNARRTSITNISPGIGISLPVAKHKFGLEYRAEIQNYSVDSATEDTKNHFLDGSAELNFPSDIIFRVKDTYKKTNAPEFSELIETVKQNNIKREQNNINAEAGFFSTGRKFSAVAVYSLEQNGYEQYLYKSALNRTISTPGLNLYYNYSPKISLLLAGNMGVIKYQYSTNRNSSKYNEVLLGAQGQMVPKTTGIVKLGVHMRKYDDLRDAAGKLKEFNEIIAGLGTRTDFSERTNLELTIKRAPVESVYFPNVYSISTYAGFKLSQKVGEKFSVSIDGSADLGTYPEKTIVAGISKKRQDTVSSAGLIVSVPLAGGVDLNAGYTLKIRNSNFSIFNYTDNIISAGCRLTF